MNQKITLPELAQRLAQAAGLTSQEEAQEFLTELTATITEALARNEAVNISGLGRFIRVPDRHRLVQFVPSKGLAKAVNAPFEAFQPEELAEDLTPDMLIEEAQSVSQATSPSQPQEPSAADVPGPAETVSSPSAAEPDPKPTAEPEAPLSPKAKEEIPGHPAQPETVNLDQAVLEQPQTSAQVSTDVRESPEEEEEDRDDYAECLPAGIPLTRAKVWPIVAGVALGFVAGAIAGFYVARWPGNSLWRPPVPVVAPVAVSPADSIVAKPAPVPKATVDTLKARPSAALEVTKAPEAVYDTLSRGRYLATIARKHYGVSEYWIYIYEENRAELPANPDLIPEGTRLRIPSIEKYIPKGTAAAAARADAASRIAKLQSSASPKSKRR